MKNIYFEEGNLVLEVTRRCNMACAHCLRGDAQELDMSKEVIEKTLDQVRTINSLTFSGGEPTLNIPAMEYALKICQEHHILVYSFYVITNGKKVTMEFLECLIRWYVYCMKCNIVDVDEYGGVSLSEDMFHEKIPEENISLLKSLSFFKEENNKTDFSRFSLINEGRARALDMKKRDLPVSRLDVVEDDEADDEDEHIYFYSDLYISADGSVRSSCDTAYDDDRYTVGSILSDSLWDILVDYA